MSFDITKPVQTRSGKKAKIICTNLKNMGFPIAAIVENSSGYEFVNHYTKEGKLTTSNTDCEWDIINVPVEIKRYKNVYANSSSSYEYDDLAACIRAVNPAYHFICRVEVTYDKNWNVLSSKVLEN